MSNTEAAVMADTGSEQGAAGYLPGEPGMWFFIIGDLLIFGVYFIAYVIYRGQQPELFLHSQAFLNQGIGVTNTLVLLTSSWCLALGTQAARSGQRRDAVRLLALTGVIGGLFPFLKLLEWAPKLAAGHTPGENLFFMYYYVMTGLHLCHVLLGLVIIGFMLRHLRRAPAPNIKFIEAGAIYWHMVDLLWLLLFALFYLMR